jgi:hypothetical protein
MRRKRRQPTPDYKLPPPYQPITGERATLAIPGVYPYSAMMQVAAEDTHKNYVICRGFDIRINRFIDYESGNADKPGIPVAKPFSKRTVGAYEIAEIHPALLPLQSSNPSPVDVPWRVGQNPGVATDGQPASLNELVDELYTDEGILINWMLIDSAGGSDGSTIEFTIASVEGYTAIVDITWRPCGVSPVPGESGGQVEITDTCQCFLSEPAADLIGRCGGAWYGEPAAGGDCEWRFQWLCCPTCDE